MKTTRTWGLAFALAGLLLAVSAQAGGAKKVLKLSGSLNLNQANAQQLDQLPGVGEKAAARIIAYRQKTPFQRAEELVKVKGFGKKKFDKLKPFLAVSGATSLKVEKTDAPAGVPAAQGRTATPKR